jgi:hypothetical protein
MRDHAATEASVCDGNSEGAGVVDVEKLPAPLAGAAGKKALAPRKSRAEQSRALFPDERLVCASRISLRSGREIPHQSIDCVCVLWTSLPSSVVPDVVAHEHVLQFIVTVNGERERERGRDIYTDYVAHVL